VAISTNSTNQLDAIILAVAYEAFKEITLDGLKGIMNANPILIDVRGFFDNEEAQRKGFCYKGL